MEKKIMLIQTRVGESDQSGSGNARITGNTRCFTTIILTLLSSSQCNAMARPSTFQPCNFQSQYPQSHCAIFPVSALLRSLTNPHQVWHLLWANFGSKPMGGGEIIFFRSDFHHIWNLKININSWISLDPPNVICQKYQQILVICAFFFRLTVVMTEAWWDVTSQSRALRGEY